MHDPPSIPPVEDAPELLAGGHLWIQERVVGGRLRFRLGGDGRIVAGNADRRFPDHSIPPAYRAAVRHVEDSLDRAALRAAVGDPSRVTFVGVSTHEDGLGYAFDRLPPALVTDVHDGTADRWLPMDRVERACERLGLTPVNALRKEVRAADFDPGRYEFPGSAWYDGPVAGVVLRDKTGHRGALDNPDPERRDPDPVSGTPDEVAADLAADGVIRTVAGRLEDADRPVTYESLLERTLDRIGRRHHRRIDHHDATVGFEALRPAVGERVQRFLDGYWG